MSGEQIQRSHIAQDLLTVGDSMYSISGQEGIHAALGAERVLANCLPDYSILVNGSSLEHRLATVTHPQEDWRENILSRLGAMSDEDALAVHGRIETMMGVLAASPHSLQDAARIQRYLPFQLPQDEHVYDSVKAVAGVYKESGRLEGSTVETKVHELRGIVLHIDKTVIQQVETSPRIIAALGAEREHEIEWEVEKSKQDDAAIGKARAAVVESTIRGLTDTPATGVDSEGRPYSSLYNQSVYELIERDNLRAQSGEAIAAEQDRLAQHTEKSLKNISKSRSTSADDIPAQRALLEAQITELRIHYLQIPPEIRNDRKQKEHALMLAYQDERAKVIDDKEYKMLKPVIETVLDPEAAVYEMGRKLFWKKLEAEATPDEVESELRHHVTVTVIKKAGLIEDLVRESVDYAVVNSDIDPSHVLENPSLITDGQEAIIARAIVRAHESVEERRQALLSNGHAQEIQRKYRPIVSEGGMTPRAFSMLKKALPPFYELRDQSPHEAGKVAFAEALLIDVARGRQAGLVMHDNPKDIEILAAKLAELPDVLTMGVIICPDWGNHEEEDGTVVYHMGELNDGLPKTAKRVLEYVQGLSERAQELQRPVVFRGYYPAWELTRWGSELPINGGMSVTEALSMLERTADTTREMVKGITNDYFQFEVVTIDPPGYHEAVAVRIEELLQQEPGKVSGVAKARADFYGNNTHGDVTAEYLAARDIAEAETGFGLVRPDSNILVVATSPSIARPSMPEGTPWIQMAHGYRG